jgi:hypothetical protein
LSVLHAVTRRQLQVGNWLVPDPSPDSQPAWRRWNHALDEPRILAALRAAARRHPARLSPTSTVPPRGQLTASLLTADSARRLPRPPAPQLRPIARSSR